MKCLNFGKIMWLLIYLIGISIESEAQSSRLRFHQINIREGLSQNSVNTIVQDTLGFIWLGTQHGLNKFDGKEFTLHSSNTNQGDLAGNQIQHLFRDLSGNIWAGTNQGLNKYNYATDNFFSIHITKHLSIKQLIEPDSNNLLILAEQGLFLFHEDSLGKSLLPNLDIYDIAYCRDSLWVASDKGVYSFANLLIKNEFLLDTTKLQVLHASNDKLWGGNKKGELFEINNQELVPSFSIEDFSITTISEDSSQHLWLGSKSRGIVVIEKTKYKTFSSAKKNPYVPNSLPSDQILTFYQDSQNVMWIGTHSGGAAISDPEKEKFTTYYHDPHDSNSLPEPDIYSIAEDKGGNIWLGTSNAELIRLDSNERFKTFYDKILGKSSLACVFVDNNNRIWLGNQKGLFRFLPQTRSFELITSKIQGVKVIVHDNTDDRLWIGTSNDGVYEWDIKHRKILTHLHKGNGLLQNDIYSLLIHDQMLHVGTRGSGLQQINLRDNRIASEFNMQELSNTKILSILSDPEDSEALWVGTSGRGLVHVNWKKNRVLNWANQKSELHQVVYGILNDDNGHLWVSSNNGLGRFRIQDKIYINHFDESCGLQSDEFNGHAYLEAISNGSERRMYFGGINGLTTFNPDSVILPDRQRYPIRFTKLEINNQRVTVGNRLPINMAMLDSLEVDYNDLPIKLSFRQLRYDNRALTYDIIIKDIVNGKSKKLPEFDNESYVFDISMRPWEHLEVANTFEVIVIPYSRGKLNTQAPASILIKVNPPFWMWWGVRLISIIGALGFFLLIYNFFNSRRASATHLRKLQGLTLQINEISRLKSENALIKECLKDIIEFFGFDFVTISHVNYIHEFIEITYYRERSNLQRDLRLKEWVDKVNRKAKSKESDEYKLDENGLDVLQIAWRNKKQVLVNGQKVHSGKDGNWKIISRPFEGKYPVLNQEIFDQYDHQNLVSICMPVIRRKENKNQDYVSAIIGAGYHKTTKKKISRQERIELEIYADNFAQAYYWALTEMGRAERNKFFEPLDDESHHLKYLVKFLKQISEFFQCEDTYFLFSLHQNDYISYDENYVIDPKVVIPTPFQSRNEHTKEYYSLLKREVYEETEVGLWGEFEGREWGSFYYRREKPLNLIQENALRKTLDEFQEKFQSKKQRYLKDRLVGPFNIFSEKKETIHEQLINRLYRYFGCQHIGLWEMNSTTKSLQFAYGSEKIRLIEGISSEKFSASLEEGDYFKTGSKFFPLKNNDPLYQNGFNGLVALPIYLDNELHSGILFYTSKKQDFLLQQDFDFVNALCNKYTAFIPAFNLAQAFPTVLNSFPNSQQFGEKEKNIILDCIMEQALKVFNADVIQLYEFEEEHQHLKSAPTDKGTYKNQETKELALRTRKLSKGSLEFIKSYSKNIWVIQNESQFDQFKFLVSKENEELFRKDFWDREEIKTLVIGRFMNKDNFLGVIIYIFRRELPEIDESKKLMEPFHDLASRAILTSNIHKIAYGEVDKRVKETADILKSHAFYVLSRGINHDVRNLLQNMVRHEHKVKKLVYEKLTNEDQQNYDRKIDLIDEVSDRIEKLLDLYKVESSRQQEIPINGPIRDTIRFVENQMGDGIKFVNEQIEPSPEIYGDLNIFTMILYNLLTNAVKAVRGKSFRSGEGKIAVSVKIIGQKILITIIDNGVGISDRVYDDIYQPYFTGAKERGVGFGLFFTREMLTKKFEGKIKHESNIGQGTTFFVELPLKNR